MEAGKILRHYLVDTLEKDTIDIDTAQTIARLVYTDDKFDNNLKQCILDYVFKAIGNRWENTLYELQEEYKRQIIKHETDFNKLKTVFISNYEDIKSKIEALLPAASALGITESFAKEMEQRQQTAKYHLSTLYIIIFIMIVIVIAYYIIIEKGQPTILNFLHLLSIEAPLTFLATLSAKKAHQNQRIYEEYAHKYTAAMTYVGLCKEVREHEEIYGKDAVKNLNEGFRHAVFRNPSAAIDQKIEDLGTPLELMERLVQIMGKPAAEALIKSNMGQSMAETLIKSNMEQSTAEALNKSKGDKDV